MSYKKRLDQALVSLQLVATRSQADSYIRMGKVSVNGEIITKTGFLVGPEHDIKLLTKQQYVSRAGFKLASIAKNFGLEFKNKNVLDVGSSTGGFTDYALQQGAKKVIAVDVGTEQLHLSLRDNQAIELYEQTDIREYADSFKKRSNQPIDIVLVDVSFISLKQILPAVINLITADSLVVAMVKPQFEVFNQKLKHKGIIKNETHRRQIFKEFELWAAGYFKIINKADSEITGEKGNKERFYLLKKLKQTN